MRNWNFDEAVAAEAAEQLRNAMKGFGRYTRLLTKTNYDYITQNNVIYESV